VKYLYVPLGGNKRRAQIIWIVFFFVGIWHDLMIRWIVWALLNCVFFSLEILILTQFHSSTALQPSLPQHSNSEDHNAQEHHKTHKDHSGMNEYVQQVFHWIKTSKWMEVVIGVSGTVNIYLLMIANLSLLYGMDTFPFMEKAFLSNSSLFILCCASLWLFCGVILMREMESKSKQSSIKDYSKK
jgi:D-alanyl-lipoteichoic acid acyltransferase DltB (MBOAT superfamily)